ncbi:Uncharacterised protein [uncultured archaeon]|nr:Uncharacterised protein [uncultured archaeon]
MQVYRPPDEQEVQQNRVLLCQRFADAIAQKRQTETVGRPPKLVADEIKADEGLIAAVVAHTPANVHFDLIEKVLDASRFIADSDRGSTRFMFYHGVTRLIEAAASHRNPAKYVDSNSPWASCQRVALESEMKHPYDVGIPSLTEDAQRTLHGMLLSVAFMDLDETLKSAFSPDPTQGFDRRWDKLTRRWIQESNTMPGKPFTLPSETQFNRILAETRLPRTQADLPDLK